MTENEALQYFTKKVRRKSEFEQYRELILNAYQYFYNIIKYILLVGNGARTFQLFPNRKWFKLDQWQIKQKANQ